MNAAVLTAQARANDLPRTGLVVAYDFTRTNFLNWSEDLTQSVWSNPDGRAVRSATGLVTTAGGGTALIRQAMPSMNQFEAWSVGLWVTLVSGPGGSMMIDAGDGAGQVFTPTATRTFFRVAVIAGSAGKWLDFLFSSSASTYLVEQVQANPGPMLNPYEKTTDGQILLDRSVRLWPAPAARNNLLNWSEDLTNSAWSKNHFTNPTTVTLLSGQGQGGRDVSKVVFGAAVSGIAQIVATPVIAGQTLTAGLMMRAETAADVGKKVLIEIKRGGSTTFEGFSTPVTLTADWQTFSVSYTFTAAQVGGFNVNVSNNVPTAASGVLVQQASTNPGAALLPYERQTDGTVPDLSLRGMRNLITNSELARTSDTVAPTGWSLQLPTGVSASWSYGIAASGVPYAQLTLTGAVSTTGSVFNLYMSPLGSGGVPVTPGGTYATSANVTQVSGPALPVQAGSHFWNTAGSYISTSGSPSASMGDEPARIAGTVIAPSAAAYATPRVGAVNTWPVESSQTRVYRISQPQFELGGAATTYQRSPNHATLGSSAVGDANDPTWTAQGLSFDGVDDRVLGNLPPMSANNTALIVFAAPSATTDFTSYIQVNAGSASGRVRISTMLNNRIALECLGSTYKSVLTATNAFTPNVPICAAVSFTDAGVIKGYLNGQLYGINTGGVSTSKQAGTVQFGMRDGGSVYAQGTIHYAAIWDRVLSDTEVAQAYRYIRNLLTRRGVSI